MEMAAAELGLVSREIDAAVAREVVDDGAPAIRLISASRAGRIELVGGVAVEQVAGFRRPAGRDMVDGGIHHEIGRASCRERGWQYVSNSVGAVSLKKKQITTQKTI